ncbi:MAG: protein translocase subunit SecD [Candidatus Pacebacteria bacterium]|nr:protein translocase subunit SecD [Candidatus Paceibacterota bacterium]
MIGIQFGLSLVFFVLFIGYFLTTETRKRMRLSVFLTLTLTALCLTSLFAKDETGAWKVKIKPGLDLRGGTQFLLELAGSTGQGTLDQAVEVIRKRVDSVGVAEPVIQPVGQNRIIVQIPGVSEADKASYRRQLERVAKLEFTLVHERSDELVGDGKTKPQIPIDSQLLMLRDRQPNGTVKEFPIIVKRRTEISGKSVANAFRSVDQLGRAVVIIEFNPEGRKKFGNLTEQNIGRRLAVILDGEVYSAPVIRSAIYGSCEISGGNMSSVEAEELASVLKNPLENPVSIIDERGVDPSLGASSVQSGFRAGWVSLVAVGLFVLLYYRWLGLVSVFGLALNILILLGLLAQFGFTLTLPGLAGLILTIGIGVDANVLVFERIREELAHHRTALEAVGSGFQRAFSSILDANVTTVIAAAILFWQGSGPVQGFATVLCLGIFSSMFAALIISRTGAEWLAEKGGRGSLHMMRLFENCKINFLGLRGPAFILSGLLLGAGLVTVAIKGEKVLGVDFTGGDLVTFSFQEKVDDGKIRSSLGSMAEVVQYQRSPVGGQEVLSLRTAFGMGEKAGETLAKDFPQAKFQQLQLDKVAGVVGNELKQKALIALILGMIAIFFYTTWRFETSFAIGAIVALLHDVLISLGIFALLGRELSLPMVGAILAVAGYSINDTIVIFDRIREFFRGGVGADRAGVMNLAINQTLSRTLLTSGTTFLAVLVLFLLGGRVINDFSLILLIGIVVGTYSSIFIASPIVLLFGRKRS